MVLAMTRPSWRFRLVEPIGKKIAFAREIVRSLELTNVDVVQGRLESLPAGEIHGAMSRATFAPEEWASRGRDLVAPDGLVLVTMGGQGVPAILDRAWRLDRFTLPISGAGRITALLRQ